MQVTDEPDAVPIELPKTHEKADIIMAYSTVPGIAQLIYVKHVMLNYTVKIALHNQ